MSLESVSRVFRKPIAIMAAGALAFSLFGCTQVSGQQDNSKSEYAVEANSTIGSDAIPLADGEGTELITINAGAAKLVDGSTDTYYFPDISVNSAPGKKLKSITVQFTSEVETGDAIKLNASGVFTKFDKSKTTNASINVAAGASDEEWEAYLSNKNNLTVTLKGTKLKSIRMIAQYVTVDRLVDYNAANGHYYELCTDNKTWTEAYAASKNKTYMGQQGYLATITDQQEHDFTYSMINNSCWIGGVADDNYTKLVRDIYADDYQKLGIVAPTQTNTTNHKTYYWIDGPEKGYIVYDGVNKVSSTNTYQAKYPDGRDLYTNWWSGEPDQNGTNEAYLLQWQPYAGQWGAYSNLALPYTIEYGDMPMEAPTTSTVDAEILVDIKVDPTGKTITTEVQNSTVGDTLVLGSNVNGGKVYSTIDGQKEEADITYTFKKKNANGEWVAVPADELNEKGQPIHAGTYKAFSDAIYSKSGSTTEKFKDEDGSIFTIKPKTITPEFTKVYDGTTTATVDTAALAKSIEGQTLKDAKVTLKAATGATASYNALSVKDATAVTVGGLTLEGDNAADYQLPSESTNGEIACKGTITPRDLVLTVSSNVSWGLAGKALKAADNSDPSYSTNLAIHSTGDWKENELAARDAKSLTDTILGAESFVPVSGSTTLVATSPSKGLYDVEVRYANVNPNGSKKSTSTLKTDTQSSSESGQSEDQSGLDAKSISALEGNAGGFSLEAEQAQTVTQPSAAAFSDTTGSAGTLDRITAEDLGGGKFDIGNYILSLKYPQILITQDPYTEDDFDSTTDFTNVLVSDEVDPDRSPLTDDDIMKLLKDNMSGSLPEGTPNIVITKDGVPVDKVNPAEVGSYAIVATYPNPDGPDKVIRVIYDVLANKPITISQTIEVAKTPGADPTTKDMLKTLVEKMVGHWLPEGVDPMVSITKGGKELSEIDLGEEGTYKCVLHYVDKAGVVREVLLDYIVKPDAEVTVAEDIIVPLDKSGKELTPDDISARIADSYPNLIPKDQKPTVEITHNGQPVDKVDPSVPGEYEVTLTYPGENGEPDRVVKVKYTFKDVDGEAGLVDSDGDDNGSDGNDNENDNEGATGRAANSSDGLDDQLGGSTPAAGTSGSTGSTSGGSSTSGAKGWDSSSGTKGFADQVLAQTGDPVFWVVCGVVVIAVAAGVVLIVTRRKKADRQ